MIDDRQAREQFSGLPFGGKLQDRVERVGPQLNEACLYSASRQT